MQSKAQGRLVLAGDPETGEIYAAQVIDEKKHGHGPETLPLVRLLRVARYPDQRAIQQKDVALELPAIAFGTYLRMAILKGLDEREKTAFLSVSWEKSLRDAQKQALKDAANDREREIIRRHLDGDVQRPRRVKCYTLEEVKFLLGKKPPTTRF